MNVNRDYLYALGALFVILFLAPDHPALASNNWTNSAGGLWRVTNNWSTGKAPDLSSGLILITNATTKTVLIDSLTSHSNLFLNNMTLLAPPGMTNTLQMTDVGTNNPLLLMSGASPFTIARGGAFQMTNSSLVITGNNLALTVWAGSVTMDSGLLVVRDEPLTSNVTVRSRIGRTNDGALNINGGVAQFGTLLVGESPGAQFARSKGTINLTGGLLNVLGELSIADSPGCTGIVNAVGGQIQIPDNLTNITRIGNYGFAQMIVSNSTVFLPNVSVARHDGSFATLWVQSNALALISDDLSIGRFSGATGNVVVAGGELIVTNQPIWVGREGVGQMTVSEGSVHGVSLLVAAVPTNTARGNFTMNGGSVLLSSNFVVGDSSISTGQVVIAGGNLAVTNSDGSAVLDISSGPLIFSGGTITTDNLRVTNSAGEFTFIGGTLDTKGTEISNAAPFIVGDGTSAATLNLQGGVHSFANGLVISANATLTGCGTVIGTIVNHGTIATNCGSSGVPPSIQQQPSSLTVTQGDTASFSVIASGDAPLSYQWRFGVPGTGGGGNIAGANGSTLVITNAQPTNAGNYRVIVTNPAGTTNSAIATLRVLVSPTLISPALSGTDFTFSFSSVAGLTNVIEFKNTLTEINWTPLTTVTGNGNVLIIDDPTATNSSRFYRVRIQ